MKRYRGGEYICYSPASSLAGSAGEYCGGPISTSLVVEFSCRSSSDSLLHPNLVHNLVLRVCQPDPVPVELLRQWSPMDINPTPDIHNKELHNSNG